MPIVVQADLNSHLAQLVVADLAKVADSRQPGHCFQVTDLPIDLMDQVCQRLRTLRPSCESYVLSQSPSRIWHISSTKLVERRNANEAVVIVFLPPNLRTSAEDSFDVSTFERYVVGDLYKRLRGELLASLPDEVHTPLREIMAESKCKDASAICRFLMAVSKGETTPEAIGLALHYLELVPDPTLLEEPTEFRARLIRNVEAVRTLSAPDQALFANIQALGINEGRTQKSLYRLLNEVGSAEPSEWLPRILDEEFIHELTFDQWDFQEKIAGDIKEIVFTRLGTTGENEDGYPLFDLKNKNLKVMWETTPSPLQCKGGLSYFTIEIMQGSIPVTEARTVRIGTGTRKTRSTTLKNIHKLDLQDGLYYLRASAWAGGGTLLHSSDSESIFLRGGQEQDDDEIEDSGRRQTWISADSIYEAKLHAQVNLRRRDRSLSDLKSIGMAWITPERRTGGRYTDQFTVKYSAANQFAISVNTILRRIERETLSDADSLGRWDLDLTQPLTAEVEPTLQPFEGIDYDLLDEFLLARKDVFQRILSQHDHPELDFLVETSDLARWVSEIMHYAGAYERLLDSLNQKLEHATDEMQLDSIVRSNHQITTIDSVILHLADGQAAYLVAPTHPLKMLWALQYARATQRWAEELEVLPGNQVTWSTFAGFLPRLSSLNVPCALVDRHGELMVNVDTFGPFWGIYLRLGTPDTRATIGRIKTVLGSPESDDRFTTISSNDLAQKVLRYLAQHPYVSTLRINVVQPGSGLILVNMLLELERLQPDLRYHLSLFSPDFRREELGAALDDMMSPPERQSGSEQLDAFLTASSNPLFPKIAYSKHPLNDIFDSAHSFDAHMTLLFDAFRVTLQVHEPLTEARSNHLYGLLHEYVGRFATDDGDIYWQRQILPQHGLDVNEDLPVHETLVRLHQVYSRLAASIASDGKKRQHVPTVCLPLGPSDKNLISQAHQVSDWVLTVDRNFGLEYIDSPYDEYCPAYLIDYQPEYLGEIGHRLITSTQHVTEMERIVQPVLENLDLPATTDSARLLIDALRSVSGRLVLKLLSSSTQAHGAVGLALARLFLEQAGLLQDMILVPLDSHPDLFASAQREASSLRQELSLRRTDLLLVEMVPKKTLVTFHLVEVKFRLSSSLAAVVGLRDEISAQLENSLGALRQLYDPQYAVPDRFDRLVRTRELATMLGFYLDRAVRYRLADPDQAKPMHRLLDQLEHGYALRFTRSGVVFALGEQGYQTGEDSSVCYHSLGRDRAEALLSVASTAIATGQTHVRDTAYETTRSHFTDRSASEILLPPAVPEEPVVELEETPDTCVVTVLPDEQETAPAVPEPPPQSLRLEYDVLLGSKHRTPQYGLVGTASNQMVALDLNGTNAISLFGVQGSGKSYTLGTILEMAVMPIENVNQLPRPLAAVVFHYSKTEDYAPEYISMAQANAGSEVESLREFYDAAPQPVPDVLVLCPEGKLEARREEFGDLDVQPITFDSSELDIEDWKFLMGAVGNDSMYIKKINQVLRRYRAKLSLENMYLGIAGAKLSATQMELASTRLDFVKDYVYDGRLLRQHICPGRLIIVDLRDELIEKDEALGLFVVMLKILSTAEHHGQPFNKLIVFDEAHNYMDTGFIKEVTGVVREMRHRGTTVLIASQDPPSVPRSIIELSSQIIIHRFSSPAWLRHVQKGAVALKELNAGRLNMLGVGEAYVWSREATDPIFERRPVKVVIRPRVTKHGGGTKTAL